MQKLSIINGIKTIDAIKLFWFEQSTNPEL